MRSWRSHLRTADLADIPYLLSADTGGNGSLSTSTVTRRSRLFDMDETLIPGSTPAATLERCWTSLQSLAEYLAPRSPERTDPPL